MYVGRMHKRHRSPGSGASAKAEFGLAGRSQLLGRANPCQSCLSAASVVFCGDHTYFLEPYLSPYRGGAMPTKGSDVDPAVSSSTDKKCVRNHADAMREVLYCRPKQNH